LIASRLFLILPMISAAFFLPPNWSQSLVLRMFWNTAPAIEIPIVEPVLLNAYDALVMTA